MSYNTEINKLGKTTTMPHIASCCK